MSLPHLLLADLAKPQIDLIKLIGRPVEVGNLADTKGWPVWDFVRRRYAANHRGDGATIDTAAEVLESLPSTWSASFQTGSYGLYWRAGAGLPGLQPTDRIGLTIAGLHHLSEASNNDQARPNLGAICVNLIAEAAQREVDLQEDNDWTKVARGSLDIRTQLTKHADPPIQIVGQILQHEFMIIARETTRFNWEIDYGAGRLERFQHIRTLADYVEVVESMAITDAAVELVPSPLRLPGTLDHLGFILRQHPAWDHSGPFVKISDFDAATRLLDPPTSQAEFGQRCSDLWTIISQLGVPHATSAAYSAAGWDPEQKGSVSDLQLWLTVQLGNDYDDVADAISTIRGIGHIRQGSQHAAVHTRKKANTALAAFGVLTPVSDWPRAWSGVLDAAAAAFYTIATTIRRLLP